MWDTRGMDFTVKVNIWAFCEKKYSLLLTFISGITMFFKSVEQKKG